MEIRDELDRWTTNKFLGRPMRRFDSYAKTGESINFYIRSTFPVKIHQESILSKIETQENFSLKQ